MKEWWWLKVCCDSSVVLVVIVNLVCYLMGCDFSGVVKNVSLCVFDVLKVCWRCVFCLGGVVEVVMVVWMIVVWVVFLKVGLV